MWEVAPSLKVSLERKPLPSPPSSLLPLPPSLSVVYGQPLPYPIALKSETVIGDRAPF